MLYLTRYFTSVDISQYTFLILFLHFIGTEAECEIQLHKNYHVLLFF